MCDRSEWTPAADNWGRDRTWTWLGQAHRIAVEIRAHKDSNIHNARRYEAVTPIPEDALELFTADRRRTWTVLHMNNML